MAVSVDGVRLTRRYQCAAQTLDEVPGFTGPLSAHHPGLIFYRCRKTYLLSQRISSTFLAGSRTRLYVTGTPCLPSVLLAQGRPHCKCLAVFLAVRPGKKNWIKLLFWEAFSFPQTQILIRGGHELLVQPLSQGSAVPAARRSSDKRSCVSTTMCKMDVLQGNYTYQDVMIIIPDGWCIPP